MENKFRAFKIYVKDEDISKELQKHLFKVGYSWEDYGQNVTFEGMRCLYGSPEGNLAIGYNYLSSFKEHPAKEYLVEEILAWETPEVEMIDKEFYVIIVENNTFKIIC